MKNDQYYQRRKCSAETLVCEHIRVMPIFVGVCWKGASRTMTSKIAIFASCGRYIFQNFTYETKIIMSEYVVLQWLFVDMETGDLE